MSKVQAICLVSGGQDSVTSLFWAKEKFGEVAALLFDYGQRHKVELDAAKKICENFAKVPYTVLQVSGLKQLGGFALTDLSIEVRKDLNERGLPNTFVPGRNIIFLTYAAAWAYQLGVHDLVTGVCQTDYSGYPDCRRGTMDVLQDVFHLGMEYEIRIHTPMMWIDKAETWKMAERLGVLDVIVQETHTCYNGVRDELHAWGYGCGDCPACDLRKKGYDKAFGNQEEEGNER